MAQGAETDAGSGARIPFSPPALETIARLFPQLEVLSLLGAGGMGAVYKARQPALDRFVALKVLPAGGAEGANFAERFNREARALARLNHPNIVAVYEFGHVEGLHFFLMEYVDGANLRQLEKAARLAPREALQLIPQICDALQYAHDEGVVHRDIKPENVLVDRKGRVKIADFGLAKILGREAESLRLTDEGQVMGTPHYMAPEQVARPLTVDHRADIYSLGVVLYEMLTGDLPIGKFPPPSSHARALQVDVRFDEVVLRALENDPERRYQNASEVKTRVENIAGGADPKAAAPASSVRPLTTGRKYLYWGKFPVVVEYGDKREISWNGTLAATSAALFSVLLGILILRVVFGLPISSLVIPMQMAILVVVWGVRRTLNQPWADELPRTPQGTVILPGKRWWQSAWFPYALIPLFTVGWTLFQVNWLTPQIRQWREKPTVAQVVESVASDGIFRASLPGGGQVELLALGKRGAAPNQWWRPDGALEAQALFEVHNAQGIETQGRALYDAILHWENLPTATDGPFLETYPGTFTASGGTVFKDGEMLTGARQAAFTWNGARLNVRVGFALKPWRILSTHDVQYHRDTYTPREPADPVWRISRHTASETKTGTQITMMLNPENRDWKMRVVAVDRQGVEHTAKRVMISPAKNQALWTSEFDGLTLKEAKEFQVQVRPVHWVEFRDVAMEPKRPVPEAKPLQFSEVIETTVTNHFDFDTGEQWSPIPTEKGRVNRKPDAYTAYGELRVSDMAFAAVADTEWSTLTPQQVIDKVYQGRFAPRALKPLNPGGSGATFVYQTRENGFGILQFVQAYPVKPGVALRYKRVERPFLKPVNETAPKTAEQKVGGSLRLIGGMHTNNLVFARSESIVGFPLHEVVVRFAGPAITEEQWNWARGFAWGPTVSPNPNERLDAGWQPEPVKSEEIGGGTIKLPARPSSCWFACPNECQLQFALADETEAAEAVRQIKTTLAQPVSLVHGKRLTLFKVGEREAWLEIRSIKVPVAKLAFVTKHGRSPLHPHSTNQIDSAVITIPPNSELTLTGSAYHRDQRKVFRGATNIFLTTLTSPAGRPGIYWLTWVGGKQTDLKAAGWEIYIHDAETAQQLQRFQSDVSTDINWKTAWGEESTIVDAIDPMKRTLLREYVGSPDKGDINAMIQLEMKLRPLALPRVGNE